MKFRLRRLPLVIAISCVVASVFIFQNCGKSSDFQNSERPLPQATLRAQGNYPQNEIIVRMYDESENQNFKMWAVGQGLELEDDWSALNMTHWSWTAPVSVAQMQQTLSQQSFASQMMFAEPNYILATPNDASSTGPSAADISALTNGPVAQDQTAAPIASTQAWSALNSAGTPVTVAVVDTGLDLTHPVFTGSHGIWVNTGEIPSNGIDDDNNGYIDDVNGWNFVSDTNSPQDDNGHGTHCSGIVLGTGQDIFASPIAKSRVRIMPLKFLDSNGSGATSDAINAIEYAVKNGAKVISNSWGGPDFSYSLESIIDYAYQNDVAFVAAAGNSTTNIDAVPFYPASYPVPQVIAVAATTNTDGIASFSNYGPSTVSIASPGVSILSTYPVNISSTGFAVLSGTSMATPFVAGTAALMIYQRGAISGYNLKTIMLENSDAITGLGTYVDNSIRLNVLKSINAASTATLSLEQPDFTVNAPAGGVSGPSAAGGGCATVHDLATQGNPDPIFADSNPPPVVVILLLLPILFFAGLRWRAAVASVAISSSPRDT